MYLYDCNLCGMISYFWSSSRSCLTVMIHFECVMILKNIVFIISVSESSLSFSHSLQWLIIVTRFVNQLSIALSLVYQNSTTTGKLSFLFHRDEWTSGRSQTALEASDLPKRLQENYRREIIQNGEISSRLVLIQTGSFTIVTSTKWNMRSYTVIAFRQMEEEHSLHQESARRDPNVNVIGLPSSGISGHTEWRWARPTKAGTPTRSYLKEMATTVLIPASLLFVLVACLSAALCLHHDEAWVYNHHNMDCNDHWSTSSTDFFVSPILSRSFLKIRMLIWY